MKTLFIILLSLPLLQTCNEEEERYEVVNKLRAIGVENNPVAVKPSTADEPQTVTLSFYVIQPENKPLSAEVFTDYGAEPGDIIEVSINETIEDPTELGGLFLHRIEASYAIPSSDFLPIPDDPGFIRLRYNVRIFNDSEEEKIVGNILVYKPDNEILNWTNPTIELLTPGDGETIQAGDVDIKGSISADFQEEWRVSWFTTEGEIENRRAKETKWKTPGSGNHSLIFTVRGLNSNTFAIRTANVNF